eukprot:TRINITY_DN24518_c0_g1_i1.p1 TRINITY_DN24518_c0_g1~~TRINITY_DN24518_c0_g1_i1.p1  ORF type:complete len:534 (-),score=99.27 TRINITY_DN24518_c0_g1_i1:25-1626(-)
MLSEEAVKVLGIHGIEAGKPPAKPELFEEFRGRGETQETKLTIQNRFYSGFSHGEVDWSKPVHAIVLDFKGDGMQLGMLLERLSQRGEQYVFVGNPLPFNGGWHFTAVNDFEHPREQSSLNPSWRNIRIWHRVNYVPTLTEDGAPAIVPRESFNPEKKSDGAIPITGSCKFAIIFLIGGLMPHTLNATLMADNAPAAQLLTKHFELASRFAAIGHGLDVLIALGTRERSLIAGYTASVFPNQEHLLQINGIEQAPMEAPFCSTTHPGGVQLVSTSYWGKDTVDQFFNALGLGEVSAHSPGPERLHVISTTESVFVLDMSKLPGVSGASFAGEPSAPTVAVFMDDVADPIEAYTIVAHLMSERYTVHLISHSLDESKEDKVSIRNVATETVFGNAMYGLKNCMCILPTVPANLVEKSIRFDGFFVAGGQCPYMMMRDAAVTSIMDSAPVAAAVCHGPEALIGSKWLHPADGIGGNFVSYYGAWMSFRDLLDRYERKKPGEICQDAAGRLFTGNAPNSTKDMVLAACCAIRAAGK